MGSHLPKPDGDEESQKDDCGTECLFDELYIERRDFSSVVPANENPPDHYRQTALPEARRQTFPSPAGTALRQERNQTYPHQRYPAGTPLPISAPDIPYDPYKHLPPRHYDNDKLDPQKKMIFTKTWGNQSRWSGEPYDLLDDKLKVLLNICYFCDVTPYQFWAVFPRILSRRAQDYYISHVDIDDTFQQAYSKLTDHFVTETNRRQYYHDWTNTTFATVRNDKENSGKTLRGVLEKLLDRLQLCQKALGAEYQSDEMLRTTVIRACAGVPELEHALFIPAAPCERLFHDLRSSLDLSSGDTSTIANVALTRHKDQPEKSVYREYVPIPI
ncbi:hypothetical protein F5883DRAFT_656357 [Diaporthe sp. PMI_573]|nr:hypothetical protein F5883DRAFT_656357 [Diaporthaceae sp. PMI_573]